MEKLIRTLEWSRRDELASSEGHSSKQWLLTNGLGGYASGTVAGGLSWRYHGLLVAALPAPFGRTVLLNQISESVQRADGKWYSTEESGTGGPHIRLTDFRLENLLPVWRYEIDGIIIEKTINLLHHQNTVHINYKLCSQHEGIKLRIRPLIHFRCHEHPVSVHLANYTFSICGEQYEISADDFPSLRLFLKAKGVVFVNDGGPPREMFYEKEEERGYPSRGAVWRPGWFEIEIEPGESITLMASTESWDRVFALSPDEALELHHERCNRLLDAAGQGVSSGPEADLVLAADQFIIKPVGRLADSARAHAAGDEVRTVIAGYHWFTDWGRDTMISLEGLTLTTARFAEARWIIRTFARHIRDGLIPNLFPEAENRGLYHTADATLWFFHALDRYVAYTNDRQTLRTLLPSFLDIVKHHIAGTRFGIHVDPADGLLSQGEEGYQLTWMDAKVGDWVVTPRRGKAVEINALWYNALRLLESWMMDGDDPETGRLMGERARQVYKSFNERFWHAHGNYLYDVIDGPKGNDSAFRPNQILSISLKHPVLEPSRWAGVFQSVSEKLFTPVGLRSLAPGNPEYKSKYFGDIRARDAAYHQGTVWAWLIGPFIDARLKVFPDDQKGAQDCLQGLVAHLNDACIGNISEIFDAESPYTPRGCIAQAWSVAEVLRCLAKTRETKAVSGGDSRLPSDIVLNPP